MVEDSLQVKIYENGPLVSICIPTYNGEKYIRQAIESVLAQTYTNFELIVSDDNSTDGTIRIVEEFTDNRIKIVRSKQNLGGRANFNSCIYQAKGKYVKVLCHDDCLFPNCIEKAVRVLEENEKIMVVTGCSTIINSNNETVMKRQLYKSDCLIEGKKFAKQTFIKGRNFFAEPSVMTFRTDIAKKINIFSDANVGFCTDWDAGLLMAYEGYVYYIAEPIASFRICDESTSVKLHKAKNNISYVHMVDLFIKHQKMAVIKLTNFNFFTFKILIKMYTVARTLVQKYKD